MKTLSVQSYLYTEIKDRTDVSTEAFGPLQPQSIRTGLHSILTRDGR